MSMDYMKNVFLWLGHTAQTETEFENYFRLDYSNRSQVCGFCMDLGLTWYDEDFVGFLRFEADKSVAAILGDVPLAQSERNKVLARCKELGLHQANAVCWYSGEIFPDSFKSYNGMKYIGQYSLD